MTASAASGRYASARRGAIRVRPGWLVAATALLGVVAVAGTVFGAVSVPPWRVVLEVVDHLPFVEADSGLDARDSAIVWELRLPRVALGLLVGGMLAGAGAAYQGVFRNPLADPYLLGASEGAGLGATLAIVTGASVRLGAFDTVPLAAFVGAIIAVAAAYALAGVGGPVRATAVLLLAGVAVSAFLASIQTFVLQQNTDSIRDVYLWLTGSLSTSGWHEVGTVLPYAVVTTIILVVVRRSLDVLAVGDEEAAVLGLHVAATRLLVVAAATLATAAAVSVSGLIGFVGIVVPHTVRLLAGTSYRVIVPLSLLFGGAFLTAADLVARTAFAPAEIPIGVVTAVVGAPFFAVILRARQAAVR